MHQAFTIFSNDYTERTEVLGRTWICKSTCSERGTSWKEHPSIRSSLQRLTSPEQEQNGHNDKSHKKRKEHFFQPVLRRQLLLCIVSLQGLTSRMCSSYLKQGNRFYRLLLKLLNHQTSSMKPSIRPAPAGTLTGGSSIPTVPRKQRCDVLHHVMLMIWANQIHGRCWLFERGLYLDDGTSHVEPIGWCTRPVKYDPALHTCPTHWS